MLLKGSDETLQQVRFVHRDDFPEIQCLHIFTCWMSIA